MGGVTEVGQPSETRARAAPKAQSRPRAVDRFLGWADRNRRWLFAVTALVYLAGFNGQWRIEPDSSLYLAIGKNLADGHGLTYHGKFHGLAFPGLPILLAGVYKLFGTDSLVPAHLVMLLIGAATLALTYRLFLLHAGRPTAVVVTLLVALSRTFYRYNYELMSDMPFLMGVMAFLVGCESVARQASDTARARRAVEHGTAACGFARRGDPLHSAPGEAASGRPSPFDWVLLVGGLVVAISMHGRMVPLLLAAVGTLAWSLLRRRVRGRRAWFVAAAAAALVALAAAVFVLEFGRDYLRGVLAQSPIHWANGVVFTNLPRLFDPSAGEALFGVDPGHIFSPVLSVAALAALLPLFFRRALWGQFVALTLLMMLALKVEVRYLLAVMPLMVFGWFWSLAWLNRRLPPGRGGRIFVALLAAGFLANFVRVGALVIEQRRTPFLAHYKKGRYEAMPEINRLVREHTGEQAWILVQHKMGRLLSFTTGRFAVEPDGRTQLNPNLQEVHALEPLDAATERGGAMNTRTRDWMSANGVGLGPVQGTPVRVRDQTWTLHRAVKLGAGGEPEPPPPPATRPTTQPDEGDGE